MDDKELEKAFEQALANLTRGLERYAIAAEQRRLKKLWQPIPRPLNLDNVLGKLTKDELRRICQYYDLKNLSALKKDQLSAELVKILPRKVIDGIKLMDEERYRFLKSFISKDATKLTIMDGEDFDSEELEYWRKTGLLFSASYRGDKIVFMPAEIVNAFAKLDNNTTANIIKRNTEWILLSQGMLYYYGVMGFKQILLQLENLTGTAPDYLELFNVLSQAEDYYGVINKEANGRWAYVDVEDTEEVFQEQKARPDLDYYKFSKSKLLKAGQPDFEDDSPAIRHFCQFLLDSFDMTKDEAKEIVYECQDIIQQDLGMQELMEYLETEIEFPSFEFVERLGQELTYLSNNTRRWILKGYTPSELSSALRDSLPMPSPLPLNLPLPDLGKFPVLNAPLASKNVKTTSNQANQTVDNIVSIKTRQKIGRNDPCPCGSGKKFKHCCGKG